MDLKGKFRFVFLWLCFVFLHQSQLICYATFTFHPESLWRGTVRNDDHKLDPTLCADENWTLENANLLCKKMGFVEGAMHFRAETGIISDGDSTIDCFYNSADVIPCQARSDPCDTAAWVACQLPGYRGCFAGQTLPGYSEVRSVGTLTIQACLNACRSTDKTYAALSGGSRCYCSNEPPRSTRIDRFCDEPCPGDPDQVCGGNSPVYSAVYETFLGSCEGSITSNKGYLASPGFPGDQPSVSTCTWNFETSFYNLTSVRVIGADTAGGRKLVTIETKAINDQFFWETMVTYDIERSEISNEIWRTDDKLEYKADDHLIYRNVSATFSPRNNLAFLLTLEVNQVDFEIPTTTNSPQSTTPNRCSCKQFSLLNLLLILVFCAGSLHFLGRT